MCLQSPLVDCLWSCIMQSSWAQYTSFVQPSLLTLTPTSLRMAKRHRPLCIALRNSAHIRSLIYVDPTRRLWWPGQKMPGLIAPFYRRMNHHLRRRRDLCKVSQRVLTETGPGPRPGPSPFLQATAPRTIQPQSPTRLPGYGVVNKLLFYVRNKKTDASTSQTPTEPPGWLEGVKGQGEKAGMELPHPCLSPQTSKPKPSIDWFPLPPSQPQHHHLPGCCRGLAPSPAWPVPHSLFPSLQPESRFPNTGQILSPPQIPLWLPCCLRQKPSPDHGPPALPPPTPPHFIFLLYILNT